MLYCDGMRALVTLFCRYSHINGQLQVLQRTVEDIEWRVKRPAFGYRLGNTIKPTKRRLEFVDDDPSLTCPNKRMNACALDHEDTCPVSIAKQSSDNRTTVVVRSGIEHEDLQSVMEAIN